MMTIDSQVTFNKVNESILVPPASRFNTNYTPFSTQGNNNYNGAGANGDSATSNAFIANLLSDSILKAGKRLSDVVDEWTVGARGGKVMWRALPSSGCSVFMD